MIKAIRAGRIYPNADGLIDADQADRDWARNTHPTPRAPNAAPLPAADDFGFARARTVREHYEALLARHEYEQRVGSLVNADEVKTAMAMYKREFRERMMAIPGAVAAKLAGLSDEREVHAALAGAIRAALIEFADSPLQP